MSLMNVPLDELIAHPERAVELAADERSRIVRRLAGLILFLESGAPDEPSIAAPPTPESDADRLLTVIEAASFLGFARSYVYEMIRRGEFPAVRRGKYVRVRRSAFEEWIRQKEADFGRGGLDMGISTMLSSSRGRERGSTSSPPARAHASRPRRGARRPSNDREPVGARHGEHSGADRALAAAPREGGEA